MSPHYRTETVRDQSTVGMILERCTRGTHKNYERYSISTGYHRSVHQAGEEDVDEDRLRDGGREILFLQESF